MRASYCVGILLLIILISGCAKAPTGGAVTIEDVREEPIAEETEQPAEEVEELAENETIIEEVEESGNLTETIPENVKIIEIKDLKFNPEELTIDKGVTVRWKHNDKYLDRDDIRHQINIIMYPFSVRSDILFFGDEFEYTFDEEGEYMFTDAIYKEALRGKITVE